MVEVVPRRKAGEVSSGRWWRGREEAAKQRGLRPLVGNWQGEAPEPPVWWGVLSWGYLFHRTLSGI